MIRRIAALVGVALVTSLALGSRADAGTVIAREALPTPVTAYDGHVVWSSYDARTRTYALKERHGGSTRRLPLASRDVPFDVDLGPGPHGVTAIYSRCRSEGGAELGREGRFGDYSGARGCDLYTYALKGQRESRVRVRGGGRASDFLPTIWRRRIAFARVFEHRRGRRGLYQYLYTTGIDGRKLRRVPGGTRGPYPDTSLSGPPSYEGEPGPIGLDLRGARLAYAWQAELNRCGPGQMKDYPLLLSELWVTRLGRAPKRVVQGCDGLPIRTVNSPSLGPDRLFYYEQRNESRDVSAHLRAYDQVTGRTADRELPASAIATARGGSASYYVRLAPGSFERVLIERLAASAAARGA